MFKSMILVLLLKTFKKALHKDVKWREVWWFRWPKSTPANVTTEEAQQQMSSCVRSGDLGGQSLRLAMWPQKKPKRDVKWREVWWSWWPMSTPANGTTEEVQQEIWRCVGSMGRCPIFQKLPIPSILFQQSNELRKQMWIIFHSNCLDRKQWPQIFDFETLLHKYQSVTNAEGFSSVHVSLQRFRGTVFRPKETNFPTHGP